MPDRSISAKAEWTVLGVLRKFSSLLLQHEDFKNWLEKKREENLELLSPRSCPLVRALAVRSYCEPRLKKFFRLDDTGVSYFYFLIEQVLRDPTGALYPLDAPLDVIPRIQLFRSHDETSRQYARRIERLVSSPKSPINNPERAGAWLFDWTILGRAQEAIAAVTPDDTLIETRHVQRTLTVLRSLFSKA